MMTTETDVIRILAAKTGADRDDVVVGIGDDAAVMRPAPDHELLLCTDTLVAGIHFPEGTEASAIGHKALAVNLSDLAAMGAEPCWALLSLALPNPDAAWIDDFATGFSELAARFGVKLVGGDTTRGPLTITVQLAGQVPTGTALRRRGAQPGDALYVSGSLGDAALALSQWRQGGPQRDAALRRRLDTPEPRVALGVALRGVAHAAIDVSDGLLRDLQHVLAASGVGATIDIDRVPRSKAFTAAGGTLEMAMGGGDDYELLFAAPDDALADLVAFEVTRIGTIDPALGIRCVDSRGTSVQIDAAGFEHFR